MNNKFDQYISNELNAAASTIAHSEDLKTKIMNRIYQNEPYAQSSQLIKKANGRSYFMKKRNFVFSSAIIVALVLAILAFNHFCFQKNSGTAPITASTNPLKGVYVEYNIKDSKLPLGRAANSTAEVIKKRLDGFGLKNADIGIGSDKHIIIKLAKTGDSQASTIKTFTKLAAKTEVLFYEVISDDSSPDGYKKVGTPIIKSGDIIDALASPDSVRADEAMVTIAFSKQGVIKFKEATKRLAEAQGSIGIYIDGKLKEAAHVNTPVQNGHAEISGEFSMTEAKQLAASIKSGVLPASLSLYKTNLSI